MKRTLILVIMLIFSVSVSAEGLVTTLIEYDSDNNNARLQIANTGIQHFHNISMSIDDGPMLQIVGVIRARTGIVKTVKLTPEKHSIMLVTNEGIFTQELSPSRQKTDLETENGTVQGYKPKVKSYQQITPTTTIIESESSFSIGQVFVFSFMLISLGIIVFAVVLLLKNPNKKKKPIIRSPPKIQVQQPWKPVRFPRGIPPGMTHNPPPSFAAPPQKQSKPNPFQSLSRMNEGRQKKSQGDPFKDLGRIRSGEVFNKLRSTTQDKVKKSDIFRKLSNIKK